MAVTLYLNNKQVFPDNTQNIKLTNENTYFGRADSYTLDVTLPMNVLENRMFFENINRLERSKKVRRMECRLYVDNRCLISGSAKTTQVTERDVKVQLLGGLSEINFLSEDEEYYIDNLPLGEIVMVESGPRKIHTGSFGGYHGGLIYKDTGVVDTGVKCRKSTIYDETRESIKTCYQYALVDIFKQMLKYLGFTIEECCVDSEPWNSIYVATAKATRNVAHSLPHWPMKTFISEFCNFFNVSVVINQEHKTVRIKDNPTFFSRGERVVIEPVDEYSTEMNENQNAHAIAVDNLSYDMSDSEHHDYDVIPDNVRDNAPTDFFDLKPYAIKAYDAAGEEDKKMKIYACPVGKYTGWLHDYVEVGGSEEELKFTQIDVFAPLIRDKGTDNSVGLKICPVAIGEIFLEDTFKFGTKEEKTNYWKGNMPSLANPTGDEYIPIRTFEPKFGMPWEEESTIQEYVTGEADIEKEDKEDRLQVMFIDDVEQTFFSYPAIHKQWIEHSMIAGFTDYRYKKDHKGNMHRAWSLSLNESEAEHYLGQLHRNGFAFNLKTKTCVQFLSKEIPDTTKIFIINNKCYGCEKIEANIDKNGLSMLMTGYFYEMENV